MTARTRRGTVERDIITAERDAAIAHRRAQGASYQQLSVEFKCATSTAYLAVQRAIAAAPVEAVTELRATECARLDAVIAKLWDIVETTHYAYSQGKMMSVGDDAAGNPIYLRDSGPVFQALMGIVKASESKRKLLGLDAPARQTITVVTEDAVDAEIRRLEQEIADSPVETPA